LRIAFGDHEKSLVTNDHGLGRSTRHEASAYQYQRVWIADRAD
jgi:hypothetical protein